jgi:hypothetical protein
MLSNQTEYENKLNPILLKKNSTVLDLIKNNEIKLLANSFNKFKKNSNIHKKLKENTESVILTTFPLNFNKIVDFSFMPSSYATYLKIFFVPNVYNFYDSLQNLRESEKIFCSFIYPNCSSFLYFDLEVFLNDNQKHNIICYCKKFSLDVSIILKRFNSIICNVLIKSITDKLEKMKTQNSLSYIYTTGHRIENEFVSKLSFHFHCNVLFENPSSMKNFITTLDFPSKVPLIFSSQYQFFVTMQNLIDFNVYKKGPAILKCLGCYKPSNPKSQSILAGSNISNITNNVAFALTCVQNLNVWNSINSIIDLRNINFCTYEFKKKSNTLSFNKVHTSNSFNRHSSLKKLNISIGQKQKIHDILHNLFGKMFPSHFFLKPSFELDKMCMNSNETYLAFVLQPSFFNCKTCSSQSQVFLIYSKFNSLKFICQNQNCRNTNSNTSNTNQVQYVRRHDFPKFMKCCDMFFTNVEFFS